MILKRTKGTVAFVAVTLLAGCGKFNPYGYLSFQATPGAVVRSMARAEFEGLFFGPSIPVEYRIEREHYSLRILIDEKTSAMNATIELAGTSGHEIMIRFRERGMRPGRLHPCGSTDTPGSSLTRYGEIKMPTGFTFLWITCSKAYPEDMVIAFDVVGESGGVTEENLQFELEHEGFYFLRHSL